MGKMTPEQQITALKNLITSLKEKRTRHNANGRYATADVQTQQIEQAEARIRELGGQP